MKILIAEDNPTSLKLLRSQLEAEGLSVLAAVDGVEALAILQRECVDAIISDILMPRMDGYRFCFEVRKDERWCHLPFIFYTSTYTSPSDEEFARNLTADRFIKKPASPGVILDALHSVLGQGTRPLARPAPQFDEPGLLNEYSERLVSKLESKCIELSQRSNELSDAHAQLRHMLDRSPVVIYALGVEGGAIVPRLVGEGINALLGFTVPETLNYEWWLGQLHPEDRDRAVGSVSETLTHGRSLTEYRLRHKDGSYRWVEDHRRLTRDSSNQPKEIFGVWADITERKKADEVLLESTVEETARRKTMAAKDMAVIFSLSFLAFAVTWRFSLFHAPLHWIVKHEETALDEAFVGLVVMLLGWVWFGFRRSHQIGRQTLIEEALRRLHGELATRVQQRTFELSQANEALRAEINERKRSEESSRQLANIVESSNDAIIGETMDGTVSSWNRGAEKIFGYTAAEIIGRSVTVLLPPDRATEEHAILDRIGSDKIFHVETRRVRKDGVQIDVAVTVSPIKDAGGRIVGASKIGHDITERRRAEFDLEQTRNQLLAVSRQAGIAEFATSVLHNVGNVLNSVNIATDCLADSLRKSKSCSLSKVVGLIRQHESDLGDYFAHDPQGKKIPPYLVQLAAHLEAENAPALQELGNLQKNVEHIKSIITVQQDSAKMSRSPESFRLTDLVEDSLKINANGLRRSDIQVIKNFEDIPPIVTEKSKLLQILVNLVRNAMQACEESSQAEKHLTIRANRKADRVRIAVADNGSGILAANLPRIFAHGFTTKKDGHGFGLHSAALAAKEMGGSLTVHSDGPGLGAVFTLELPGQPGGRNS